MTKPNDQQAAFLEATNKREIVLIAGPGSGKTQSVAWRIAADLEAGRDPKSCVAITFTNDAAAELRARIAALCGEELAARFGFIGTVHAFALRIIRSHNPGRVVVLDELDAKAVLAGVAKELRYRGSLSGLREQFLSGKPNIKDSLGAIVLKKYRQTLLRYCATDLDFILIQAAQIVRTMPIKMSNVCLYVDEYQDSGVGDEAFYEAMMAHCWCACFVGDSDQAIYGFRGGKVENLMSRFATVSNQLEGWAGFLEDNYRCGSRIAGAAQCLIECSPSRIKKRTISRTGTQGEVGRVGFPTAADELDFVVRFVRDQINTGTEPTEIAVLSRYNSEAREIAKALEARKIPVRRKHQENLPIDWRMACAFLNLLNDPGNQMALAVWKRHKDGKAAQEGAIAASLYEQAQTPIRNGPDVKTAPQLSRALYDAGISDESAERILEALEDPDAIDLTSLNLSLQRQRDQGGEFGKGVTCTTMHASKGREFETVILPAFEDEAIPASDDREPEERRLAYVAMTRAKTRLCLTHAATRPDPWTHELETRTPSRFCLEAGIPEDGI